MATQLHSLPSLSFLFSTSLTIFFCQLYFLFIFALFLKLSSPHPWADPPSLFFLTSRALYFHASLHRLLALTQIIISSISFQPSPSPTTFLLHCFNHHHGKVVTSLPRVSCMKLEVILHFSKKWKETHSRVANEWSTNMPLFGRVHECKEYEH